MYLLTYQYDSLVPEAHPEAEARLNRFYL
jgi:hypothetical protein